MKFLTASVVQMSLELSIPLVHTLFVVFMLSLTSTSGQVSFRPITISSGQSCNAFWRVELVRVFNFIIGIIRRLSSYKVIVVPTSIKAPSHSVTIRTKFSDPRLLWRKPSLRKLNQGVRKKSVKSQSDIQWKSLRGSITIFSLFSLKLKKYLFGVFNRT